MKDAPRGKTAHPFHMKILLSLFYGEEDGGDEEDTGLLGIELEDDELEDDELEELGLIVMLVVEELELELELELNEDGLQLVVGGQ